MDGGTQRTILELRGGMYLDWVLISKPIHRTDNQEEPRYTERQESIKKNIEHCFRVLLSRWEIMQREKRRWKKKKALCMCEVCMVIKNMVVSLVSTTANKKMEMLKSYTKCMRIICTARTERELTMAKILSRVQMKYQTKPLRLTQPPSCRTQRLKRLR